MKQAVWALFLMFIFASNSHGQRNSRGAVAKSSVDQQIDALNGDAGLQPMIGAPSSPPAGSGTVSVEGLKMPGNARRELKLAVKAYQAANWRDSATHLEKLLAFYPQFSPAHNALGGLYVNLHDYDKALGEFEKATTARPGSAQEMHNLSGTLYLLKRYNEAESTARATLAIDPLRPATRYLLASILIAQERWGEEVMELLRQSSKEIPGARLVLAQALYKRGAVDEAANELRAYLETPNASGRENVECWLGVLTHKVERASCVGK
jgi:tetratricopeptide (TPR) repeat protein